MQLNSGFIENIKDLYGEAWLQTLPSVLNLLCKKYGLRFIQSLPNLTYHFVGLVEILSSGAHAILKVAPIKENIRTEAICLQAFEQGVAKIYWFDESHHAFLMEQLVPGKPLKSIVNSNDDKATQIICQTIRALQAKPHPTLSIFKHLSEHAKHFEILKDKVDKKLLSQAISLFKDLTHDRTQDVLLHGDLHHDNILSCEDGWKAIDPHGYIGDPTFEIGPMIYNPNDCFPNQQPIAKIIERRLSILAQELPFDAQRIKAWAFCMTILSIAWTFEDHHQIPALGLQIAEIINNHN